MSFEKWLEKYNSAFLEALAQHAEYRGGLKMKDKTTMLIPKGLEEKSVQLFNVYMLQRTNKWLVWATWALAIGTLILSGLTLYLQFLRGV